MEIMKNYYKETCKVLGTFQKQLLKTILDWFFQDNGWEKR
jgi:hypothetical protein